MAIRWTSGTRQQRPLCDVCAGDVIDVRLASASALERAVDGYPPHLVFVPAFDVEDPDRIGGTTPLDDDPVEFRLDLAPTYFPLRGQLYLDGGDGIAYEVAYSRSRCRKSRAREDWVITLRGVTTTPIQFPRGVYAISVPRDETLVVAKNGDSLTLDLATGHRCPLGHLGQGTVAAASGSVQVLHCHVRL